MPRSATWRWTSSATRDPATHDPVPIQRLMLHHIVFLNPERQDQTCPNGYVGFDNRPNYFGGYSDERFYAAGEERLKLTLPQGYGYQGGNPGGTGPWSTW